MRFKLASGGLSILLLVALLLSAMPVLAGDQADIEIVKTATGEEVQCVKGEVLVRFKEHVSTAEATESLGRFGARSVKYYDRIGVHRVKLPRGMKVKDALSFLSSDKAIEYAEPNYIVKALPTFPNDPRLNELWGLDNTGQTGGTPDADIDAPEAWDVTTGSSDVVVAVIDTGVDYEHEDLAANMWVNPGEIPGNGIDDDGNGFPDDIYGWDFYNDDPDPIDDYGHGTHCAGIIGAVGNNGTGVAGVNWDVKIMALKFLNSSGSGSTSDAIDALNYVTMMKERGVNVLVTSNSWGGGGYNAALEDAIAAARDADILFVAAAGNDSMDNDESPHYPSSYELENIIAVAATDHDDQLASFSNWGATSVDLAAPGEDILSTTPGDNYELMSGTSMATPHVAGVAALIYSLHPDWTYDQVKDVILNSVDPLGLEVVSGGRLNAHRALLTFEVGQVSLDHNWQTVNFTKSFNDPVVVAKPLSFNGAQPAVVRIRNVTPTSFDIRVQEWNYLDGFHVIEQVSWLAMERGHWTLPDGTEVEAGTIDTNSCGTGSFAPVSFSEAFPSPPVVISSVMTFNGAQTAATRNQNVTTAGFEVTMQEQEKFRQIHVTETISYIAWEPGSGTVDGMNYKVALGGNVKGIWTTVNYGSFASPPLFLADMQTTNGRDTANLRYRNKLTDSVEIKVSEEKSKDTEVRHINESLGYFAFE